MNPFKKFQNWFEDLHPGWKAAFIISIIVFVGGVIVLILWLTGVLLGSGSSSTTPSNPIASVSTTPTGSMYAEFGCISSGSFGTEAFKSDNNNDFVNGTDYLFGLFYDVIDTGSILVASSRSSTANAGLVQDFTGITPYASSSNSYDNGTNVTDQTSTVDTDELAFTLTRVSPTGTSRACAITLQTTNSSPRSETNEYVRLYRKSTSSSNNFSQAFRVVHDTYDRVFNVTFDGDDRVLISMMDANSSGGVLVYKYVSGSTWSLQQTLTAPTPASSDLFGVGVVIYENVLGISAAGQKNIYWYTRTNADSNWTLDSTKTISGPSDSVFFQYMTMTAQGKFLAVGDPFTTVDSTSNAGRVRIYARNSVDDVWTQKTVLSAPTVTATALFGSAVSAKENILAVVSGSGTLGEAKRPVDIYYIDPSTYDVTHTQTITVRDRTNAANAYEGVIGKPAMFSRGGNLYLIIGQSGIEADGEVGLIHVYSSTCE